MPAVVQDCFDASQPKWIKKINSNTKQQMLSIIKNTNKLINNSNSVVAMT